MKKVLRFPFLFFILLVCSCDPGYQTDYYYVNRSTHIVTIRALMDSTDMYFTNFRGETWMFFENPSGISIEPGSRFLIHHEGGLGFSTKDGTAEILQHYILGYSVCFEFDNGACLFYKPDEWAPNNPYIENNYSFRLTHVSRGSSEGEAEYIITQDDFSRALALKLSLPETEKNCRNLFEKEE